MFTILILRNLPTVVAGSFIFWAIVLFAVLNAVKGEPERPETAIEAPVQQPVSELSNQPIISNVNH